MTIINQKSISGITSITFASAGDDLLTFHSNNGTERFRIDNSGNTKITAGIVTTLTVTGDVDIADKIVHTGDTNTAIRFPAADTITAETGGTERLRITSAGKIGIGNTTSPTADLEVAGTTGTASTIFVNAPTHSASKVSQSVLKFGYAHSGSPNAVAEIKLIEDSVNSFNGNLTFGVPSNNGSGGSSTSEALRIKSNGNIGIGSDNPQKKLDVAGDVKILDNSPRLEFYDANSSSLSNVTGGFETFDKSGNRATYVGAGMENGGNIVEFGTNNTFRAIIDSSGNFGVGTNSPNAGLNVGLGGNTIPTAGASTGSALFGNATGGNAYGLVLGATSGGVGYISAQRADGAATTYNLALQPNGGNIGVGTASPSSLLHLNANATALRITRGSSIGFLYNSGANSTDPTRLQAEYGPLELYTNSAQPIKVIVNGTEEARFLSGGGLTFNGDTATANALDDYEEGTWTPAINGASFTTAEGLYTKIGRQVLVQFNVATLSTSLSAADRNISGLPFTSANINQVGAAYIGDTSGVTYNSGYGNIYARVNANSTQLQLLQKKNDGSTHTTAPALGTGLTLRGYAWYTV